MNILFINGSPNKDGNTVKLTRELLKDKDFAGPGPCRLLCPPAGAPTRTRGAARPCGVRTD